MKKLAVKVLVSNTVPYLALLVALCGAVSMLVLLCVGAAGIAIDATRALTGVQVAYTATLPVVVVAATILFVAKAPQWRAGWCIAAGIAAYGGYVLYAVSCLPAV